MGCCASAPKPCAMTWSATARATPRLRNTRATRHRRTPPQRTPTQRNHAMRPPARNAMTEHGQASAAGGGAGPGLRLHPWSWLFVLLAQLRSFAVPLLALLLFGRGDAQWMQWEL